MTAPNAHDALLLVAVIHIFAAAHGMDAAEIAAQADNVNWRLFAAKARVPFPSEQTRALVVRSLQDAAVLARAL